MSKRSRDCNSGVSQDMIPRLGRSAVLGGKQFDRSPGEVLLF